MTVQDVPRPRNSVVFIRGETENRGPVVPRQFLEVLSGPTRAPFTNGSGRLELAQAIVNPGNPLTPRVLVNRVWLHHFGEGMVTTPDDFGTMSEPPSHPELLDYLASQFVANGWSLKRLHREIMLSSVYQQTADNNPRYAQIDPSNRLLWRANLQRLEFEALRDSLLAIGGVLDTNLYGRPVDLDRNPDSTRRTIYAVVDRTDLPDAFVNFDFANPEMPSGKRYETFVPQQALFMMNSPVVIEQAKKLVALKDFETCADDTARIQFLYDRIYQRLAHPAEIQLGLDFVTQPPTIEQTARELAAKPSKPGGKSGSGPRALARQQRFERNPPNNSRKRAPLTSWQEYAHALLQANEASFVD